MFADEEPTAAHALTPANPRFTAQRQFITALQPDEDPYTPLAQSSHKAPRPSSGSQPNVTRRLQSQQSKASSGTGHESGTQHPTQGRGSPANSSPERQEGMRGAMTSTHSWAPVAGRQAIRGPNHLHCPSALPSCFHVLQP